MQRKIFSVIVLLGLAANVSWAQQDGMQMPPPGADAKNQHQHGMPMPEAPSAQHMHERGDALSAVVLHHASSGTSVAPASTAHPMLMKQAGGWMLMLHGVAFLADIQQSGPR